MAACMFSFLAQKRRDLIHQTVKINKQQFLLIKQNRWKGNYRGHNQASLLSKFADVQSKRLKKLKLDCGLPHLLYSFI